MRLLITALTCLALLALATSALAQVRGDAHLLTINGSYAQAKSVRTDDTNDGAGFNLGYEKVARSREWTIGGGFGMIKSSENFILATDDGDLDIEARYTDWMVSAFGRIYIAPKSALNPYLGFGLGISFMGVSLNTETDDISDSSNGVALSVPLGLHWFIGQTFLLNANYTFNYLANNEYIDGNIMHSFNLGFGVQMGR